MTTCLDVHGEPIEAHLLNAYFARHPEEDPLRRMAIAVLLQGLIDWAEYDERRREIQAYAEAKLQHLRDQRRHRQISGNLNQRFRIDNHRAGRWLSMAADPPDESLPHCAAAQFLRLSPRQVHQLYRNFQRLGGRMALTRLEQAHRKERNERTL